MQLLFTLFGLFGLFISFVNATALTYRFQPNEKSCFFALNKEQGAKLAFYFAVQSGGSFDIDYRVTAPSKKIIVEGNRERQGDFVFTGNEVGEYSFCFDNEMSTVTDKTVDFEIAITHFIQTVKQIEHEVRAQLPSRQGAPAEQTSVVSESIYKLSGQLSTITRNQKYFRTRENRNFSTVRSTEQRIYRFSIMEGVAMVAMGALQVFVVRFFFTGARKGRSQQTLREFFVSFFVPGRAIIFIVAIALLGCLLICIADTALHAIYHLVSAVVRALAFCRGTAFDQSYVKGLVLLLVGGAVGYLVTEQYDNNPMVPMITRSVRGWTMYMWESLQPVKNGVCEWGICVIRTSIRITRWVGLLMEQGIDRLAGGPD